MCSHTLSITIHKLFTLYPYKCPTHTILLNTFCNQAQSVVCNENTVFHKKLICSYHKTILPSNMYINIIFSHPWCKHQTENDKYCKRIDSPCTFPQFRRSGWRIAEGVTCALSYMFDCKYMHNNAMSGYWYRAHSITFCNTNIHITIYHVIFWFHGGLITSLRQ